MQSYTFYPNRQILQNWIEKKTINICYCLSTFFNYLAKPRDNYLRVTNKQEDILTTKPIITRDMAEYVISEIFPCSNLIKKSYNKIPENFALFIDYHIKKFIENKEFNNNKIQLTIEPTVHLVIYKYIKSIESVISSFEEEIPDNILIEYIENQTMSRRVCNENYGFNTDIENCSFQALLYIMTSITDWLDYNYIGKDEVLTAYKIIVPQDLQKDILPTRNKMIEDIISSEIITKDLIPTDEAVQFITSIIIEISNNLYKENDKNFSRIINRFMAFSNPI